MILRTQGVVLALTGGVCARLALTDAHLRFVNGWMTWPLLATAVVLLVLAVRVVLLAGKGEEERVPAASWLLLAPIVAVFVISPRWAPTPPSATPSESPPSRSGRASRRAPR